jgi:pre-mRNA-splicing factor SPF27
MAASQPLALGFGGAETSGLQGWRRDEHLIDALPYADAVDPALQPVIEALIEEEKRRSTKLPSDYLKELPPVRPAQPLQDRPVLKAEYDR